MKIADQDCTFIARTLAEEARQSPTNTQAPSNATVAALGGVVSPEIILKPLPQAVTERVKSVAQYQYFIEGNDIALVDPQDRRVVAKIDVRAIQDAIADYIAQIRERTSFVAMSSGGMSLGASGAADSGSICLTTPFVAAVH